MLATLEHLLAIEIADLEVALVHCCDLIAAAVRADKVDAFLYTPSKDSLVAIGSSTQPLSALQHKLGLDVLPVSNGGRAVEVYAKGTTFFTGRLDEDGEEVKGVKEALKIRSQIGVALHVDGRRRGMLMIASQKPDFFTAEDVRFAEAVARWVSTVTRNAEMAQEIARNAVEQGRRAVADELITVLAHDLRNLLAPIVSRLQLMRFRARTEKRDRDIADCEAAERSTARLNRLISDLLDVARLDQGVLRLDVQPVDLAGLARESAHALATAEHDVHVDAAERVVVAADPDRIRQCIENVLSNAIRHSPHGADVNVFVRAQATGDGDWGVVEIHDQGPGIPAEILPRIFDKFVSGSKSSGLGLGLYLAKRIAVAHGGDLTADSTAGLGARFTLRLAGYREEPEADQG
ncbi:MAG TPA: GAF domain-containing sensor histidine kinase [Polyangia bacterium]|nr:GAF domain-containing sensor histidine kinase [Polyangia bacterium]